MILPNCLLLVASLLQAGLVGQAQAPAAPHGEEQPSSTYVLGRGDEITIVDFGTEDFGDKPYRIDATGSITLPLVGRMDAAGQTTEHFQRTLNAALATYVRVPQAVVRITSFHSQPVSIIGAVGTSGVHQLQGEKTLIEMLSAAGGLRQDASYHIKITREADRGPIPLATAQTDPSGRFIIAEVNVKSLIGGLSPKDNIIIKPNDIISVPRAEMVYVVGEVGKPGGFVLNEHESISVLQALSLAEGLVRSAAPSRAVILRPSANAGTTEIPVELTKILAGKQSDVPLSSNDILFVPSSASKKAFVRGLEAAIQLGTGIAIFRRP